ncbi:MAG: class I SAM-dependent methyltransferase [Actinomycetota bacterium]
MLVRTMKRLARRALEHTSAGSRFLIRRDYGVSGPHGHPDAPWICAVLKSAKEVQGSLEQVQRLGLPPVADLPKNWDSLAALDLILRTMDTRSRIFDAGGEWYSMILPWLFLYGYKSLTAGNLVFDKKTRRGTIVYGPSDITDTKFSTGSVDAVTCLSVIEHGVDLDAYFREMSRIIRDGGILITSTDYYDTPIDTKGQEAYGVPIHIFTKDEITQGLELAARYGFSLMSPIDLRSAEKVVHWKQYDLRYTFVIFSLQKRS